MNVYSMARERSFEDMSAIGKNLRLAAIMSAGGAHD
jgi:hypothetical protein